MRNYTRHLLSKRSINLAGFSPETVQQAYDRNLAEFKSNIEQLQTKLQYAQNKHKMEEINWCHVGDLAHYNEILNQITNPEL